MTSKPCPACGFLNQLDGVTCVGCGRPIGSGGFLPLYRPEPASLERSASTRKMPVALLLGIAGFLVVAITPFAVWETVNEQKTKAEHQLAFDAKVEAGRAAVRSGDIVEAERCFIEALDYHRDNKSFLHSVRIENYAGLPIQCRIAAGMESRLNDTILSMTSEEFDEYSKTGRIEGKSYVDDPDINSYVVSKLENRRPEAAQIRSEEAKRQANERKQQELAAKEAERAAKRGDNEAEAPNLSDIETFSLTLRSMDDRGRLFVRVSEGTYPEIVVVTVSDAWHYEPYQIRYQATQNLWRIWAGIRSPQDVDKARIKIVDRNGNEVGGSRMIAGSIIWVDE